MTPLKQILGEQLAEYEKVFKKYNMKSASDDEGNTERLDTLTHSVKVEDRVTAAKDEFNSDENLSKLAKDSEATVRRAILDNTEIVNKLNILIALLWDGDNSVKEKAQEIFSKSEEGQVKFAKEGTKEEKLRVCKLPSISGTAQLLLAKDSDKEVRRALLYHKYLTAEALTKLAEGNDAEFKELILAHPSCSEGLKKKLTSRPKSSEGSRRTLTSSPKKRTLSVQCERCQHLVNGGFCNFFNSTAPTKEYTDVCRNRK
jgi:hypothetical protein